MFGGGNYGGYYGGGASLASIPEGIHVPQMPPVSQYIGQMMSMREAMQMQQLRQAEMQNQNLQAQGRQRDLDAATGIGKLIGDNTTDGQPAPPAPSNSMAGALAPSGDYGGEAGPATPVPATPAQAPDIAGLAAQHQIGDIHGYLVTDWNAVRQKAYRNGWANQFDKLDADRRANEAAAITNQKNQLGVVQDKLGLISQAMQPLETIDPKASDADTQRQNAWRVARNTLIGNKVVTEDQMPYNYDQSLADNWFKTGKDAQKVLTEHQQYYDAIAKTTETGLKNLKETSDIANGIIGNSQNQDDVINGMLRMKQNGTSNDQLVNLFPVARDTNGQPLIAQNGVPILAQWTPQMKAQAQAALVPAQQQPQTQEKILQNLGPRLATAFDKGPQQYKAALSQIETQYPDFKGTFPQDPRSREDVMQAAMPATAYESQQVRQQRADIQQQNADRLQEIADLRKTNAGQMTAYQQQQVTHQDEITKNKAQAAAAAAWDLNQRAKLAQKANDDEKFSDPKTGVIRTMDATTRKELAVTEQTAYHDALAAQAQSDEMQAKHGWGKFAGKAAPQGAPPAAAPPAAGPKAGDTRVLSQADVDRLTQRGMTGYKAGQSIRFTGNGWQ